MAGRLSGVVVLLRGERVARALGIRTARCGTRLGIAVEDWWHDRRRSGVEAIARRRRILATPLWGRIGVLPRQPGLLERQRRTVGVRFEADAPLWLGAATAERDAQRRERTACIGAPSLPGRADRLQAAARQAHRPTAGAEAVATSATSAV